MERDEHAIWNARWRGRQVVTPDGGGICCGFHDDGTGVQYQVRTVNPQGVTTWRHYPRAELKLKKEKT